MARNGRVAKPFHKDGIYYVRRRVPQDLVTVVGKQLYLKSLGTSVAAEAAHCFPANLVAADAGQLPVLARNCWKYDVAAAYRP